MTFRIGRPVNRKYKIALPLEEVDCQEFAAYMRILAPRHGIIWTHTPSGGKRHIKTAVMLQRMGLRAGVWDYYFRKKGLPTLWIEFKRAPNKLTNEQADWKADLIGMGDEFEVVYSARQGLEALTRRGFIPHGGYIPYGGTIRIPVGP